MGNDQRTESKVSNDRVFIMILILLLLIALSISANTYSATVGASSSSPGYSATDILLNQGGNAPTGIYWVDPDLPGGNSPVQVFSDMTTEGGGWMLANDADNGLPALNEISWTINEYAVNQQAQIRFVGTGLDAYYTGFYYQATPILSEWTVLVGNVHAVENSSWQSINQGVYDIYIRETTTISYPAPVPIPAAAWFFASAIIGALSLRKKYGAVSVSE